MATRRKTTKTTPTSELAVEVRPIESVKPYGKNPRRISDRAVTMVAASLSEFGWRQPLVVDDKGVLLVGHTRLLAAKSLGYTEVPVHVATGLTPEQAQAYRIADNRSHDFTDWDPTLLMAELEDLPPEFEEILALADWQQIVAEAEQAMANTNLDLDPETVEAVWGGFQLVVTCASEQARAAIELLLLDAEGVTDVRRKIQR